MWQILSVFVSYSKKKVLHSDFLRFLLLTIWSRYYIKYFHVLVKAMFALLISFPSYKLYGLFYLKTKIFIKYLRNMVYFLKSCVLKNNLCYNYIRKINEKSIVGEGSIIGIFYCQKL